MSQKSLTVYDPFRGEPIKSYNYKNLEEAKLAVERSRKAQRQWSQVPLSDRIRQVEEALQYFDQNREVIAKDICLQMGRPLSQAAGEVKGFFERANHMCEIAPKTLEADVIEDGAECVRRIEHVPLGVVFTVAAWNYPLMITVNSLVPALIAGNSVILKESSRTPEIGEHFQKAFANLGGHKDLVQHLVLTHEVTGKLIEEANVDHIVFTGSVSGGRQIVSHAARSPNFLSPQLELGGKDAAFVAADADITHAAESIVDGAVFNSGQSCCGIERVYVDKAVYDQFVSKCKDLMESYVLGDPQDPQTTLGPLAVAGGADLMASQVKQAVEQGAQVLTGGNKKLIEQGVFFEPTLIVNVRQDMSIIQEENFGPLLPVIKVSGMKEAIDLVNDSQYGLTTAIYTNDKNQASEFAQAVETGTVFMNRCDYLDPALPWTGVKNSGSGASLSKYGYLGLTRRKGLNFRILNQN